MRYYENQCLAYAEYGDKRGIPLLVQHGSIASIRDGLEGLGHARVICVARPGYGESSPCVIKSMLDYGNIIALLVEELKIGDFDILSSSAGAPYGYALAKACSHKVRNIYVYSGTPALYDEEVQSLWPFPVAKDLTQEEAEKIAYEVFFSGIPKDALDNNDVKDSMMNNCFGEGQNIRIRFRDWGFKLSEIKAKVYMQHSKEDPVLPYKMAVRTAALLPGCDLELLERGPHFSVEGYKSFIEKTVTPVFNSPPR
jgi:pimeloyl-ACP methyl ester carboxylesterase